MWCKTCNIETNDTTCPICGAVTVEDIPTEIYWCSHCQTPIIQEENQIDKGICPLCGLPTKYMAKDLRPVFPEERLLIEILLNKKPHQHAADSVWAADSRYYINGKAMSLSSKLFQDADADDISQLLNTHKPNNTYVFFDKHIETFIKANSARLHYIKDEANDFIHRAVEGFDPEVRLPSVLFGGTGYESANQEMPDSLPEQFEMGTQNTSGLAGLNAALYWGKKQTIQAIWEREQQHRQKLLDILSDYWFIQVIGNNPDQKYVGIVSCLIDGISSDSSAGIFDRCGISVRTGLQCAPLAHQFLGTYPAGTIRFSVSFFTTDSDFEQLRKVANGQPYTFATLCENGPFFVKMFTPGHLSRI